MAIYTFETRPRNNSADYGGTHFTIIADNKKQAWKKALEIEYRKNIIRIVNIKEV